MNTQIENTWRKFAESKDQAHMKKIECPQCHKLALPSVFRNEGKENHDGTPTCPECGWQGCYINGDVPRTDTEKRWDAEFDN